ncbi:MAG TPA: endonuclease/exonuclease/phosphatase family protein [Candidatus Binataceae bacterium]|nr:endonuclease/exonuclease/phosphatase family protein [Candidatus Binataceae bacterium]
MDSRLDEVSQRRGRAHRFAPIIVNRATPRREDSIKRDSIKVVAFNARGGARLDGIIKCLQRAPLAGAEVILLCEADWRHRRSAWREFAAELAAALKMSLAFLPQFGVKRADGEPTALKGNAILCSQPLEEVRAAPIPNRFLHPRLTRMAGGPAGVIARASFNGRPITLGVVHLNSRWDPPGREWQMREYLAQIPDGGPAIIGGDLNTTTIALHNARAVGAGMLKLLREPRRLSDPRRWETLFARLAQAEFEVDGANARDKRTFTFFRAIPRWLRPNLDWIAVRGLAPLPHSARAVAASASFLRRRVSDHDFIMCEVALVSPQFRKLSLAE